MKKLLLITLCIALIVGMSSTTQAVMLRKGKIGASSVPSRNTQDYNRTVLPKTGDIAVIVEGPDPQHRAMAEAYIIEELTSWGYRVVDEARMKKIRAAAARAQAARYALAGNIDGILRINGSYNAAATIVANVRAGMPERNEFKLFTGTASAAMIAVTSRGVKLGGKTAQGKAVGYTRDEAMLNALNAAVKDGLSQMF